MVQQVRDMSGIVSLDFSDIFHISLYFSGTGSSCSVSDTNSEFTGICQYLIFVHAQQTQTIFVTITDDNITEGVEELTRCYCRLQRSTTQSPGPFPKRQHSSYTVSWWWWRAFGPSIGVALVMMVIRVLVSDDYKRHFSFSCWSRPNIIVLVLKFQC